MTRFSRKAGARDRKEKGIWASLGGLLAFGVLVGILRVCLDFKTERGRLAMAIDSVVGGGGGLSEHSSLRVPHPESPDIRDSLLQVPKIGAEPVWESLLKEASELMKNPTHPEQPQQRKIAFEVGMFRAKQSVEAAQAGLEAYGVEPSPRNFQRVKENAAREPKEIQDRLHLHNKAAGDTSGLMVDFTNAGSTGDHVGFYDVWNMKVEGPTDEEIKKKMGGEPIKVPTLRLDDLIDEALSKNTLDNIFLLKIDTQGFEPSVFAGLEKNVFQQPHVDFILFEYWPKGMDLMTLGDTESRTCKAAEILKALQKAGYVLYALPNTSHPRAPAEAKRALRQERAPLQSIQENCMYYYQFEDRFPSPDYHVGYWSDILAVAPHASLPQNPVTEIGQVLQQQQQQQ